jgi:putative ABC transport system permease protein
VALSPLGGTVGLLIGGLATVGYSLSQGWPPTVPLAAVAGGLAGAAADVYPSIRARLTPTEALAAL